VTVVPPSIVAQTGSDFPGAMLNFDEFYEENSFDGLKYREKYFDGAGTVLSRCSHCRMGPTRLACFPPWEAASRKKYSLAYLAEDPAECFSLSVQKVLLPHDSTGTRALHEGLDFGPGGVIDVSRHGMAEAGGGHGEGNGSFRGL
jgi:hypothetical protein